MSATQSTASRPRRWLKWLALTALVGALLAGVAWQTRERWLAWVIEAWVVTEPVETADAAVVLGGGAQYRAFAAARYFSEKRVPKVLYPNIAHSPAEAGRTISHETELIGRVLEHEGVPKAAQETIGKDVTSTRDEILAVREWAQRNGAHTILVPTDPYHTRRLSRLGRKVFAGSDVRLVVVAVDPPGYRWQEWWRHDRGVLAFQNELI
ncbi:MAG: YdcF family protein, partial [Limisphaerales bacterium]